MTLIEKRILGEDGVHSDIPGQLVKSIAVGKFSRNVKVFLSIFFPTREEMVNRYQVSSSSKKIYFYYLIRPFYLFSKYGEFILEIIRLRKHSIGN